MHRAINETHFFLVMKSAKQVAELMAECNLCDAITMQPLELAWLDQSVECSNCGIMMPVRADVLSELRQQANDAQSTLDRLVSAADPVCLEGPLRCWLTLTVG